MEPTAKSHIYNYFQAMSYFFLFLTLQKIINAEKIGFYLKYFLRNDFLTIGPVCSKTVVECHFHIFLLEVGSFVYYVRTINAITHQLISFNSHISHFESKINSVE